RQPGRSPGRQRRAGRRRVERGTGHPVPLYEPPEYKPHRLIDRARYQQGLPNMFGPDQAAPPRR
ncbi:MAG: hypothetical protein ACRDYF_00665, partial [Acidimicrobiia bacterium]